MLVAKMALRMAGWLTAALMLAVPAAADPVTERGLRHTSYGRGMVEKAVLGANQMAETSGARLVPSWIDQGTSDVSGVLVYLVDGKPGTIDSPAAVPKRCRCVFVAPTTLDAFVTRNSTGAGRMTLDAGRVLTFMLLHEIGHLLNNTPGADFHNGQMFQLNIEDSLAKDAESDADNFAADLLKRLALQSGTSALTIYANWITIELTKMSWNMQAFRTLDEFASFAVGKPAVYFDDSYTHPNLALRILHINDRIHSSEATRALLQAFENARFRGANPQPLYQRR